jgi:hypothetical protein
MADGRRLGRQGLLDANVVPQSGAPKKSTCKPLKPLAYNGIMLAEKVLSLGSRGRSTSACRQGVRNLTLTVRVSALFVKAVLLHLGVEGRTRYSQ